MSQIIDYYEQYHKALGEKAYRLEKQKDSSRVLFIKNILEVSLKPGAKILDVGCGDFYLSKIMPQFDWHGIDVATDFSDKIVKQDLCTAPYPFEDKTFDAVVCSEVLEHLWYPTVVHHETKRLLKDDGYFILSTPNHDNIDWVLDHHRELLYNMRYTHQTEHIRFYNFEVHQAILEQTGFKVVYHTGCDAHFVKFFQHGRTVLFKYFKESLKLPHTEGQVDQLLGQMFPEHDSGILVVSQKSNKVKENAPQS